MYASGQNKSRRKLEKSRGGKNLILVWHPIFQGKIPRKNHSQTESYFLENYEEFYKKKIFAPFFCNET